MNILSEARRLRKIIELASENLDDKMASEAPELFPSLKYDGNLIKAGTRINWLSSIKKAMVDLWDVESNSPHNAPDLWENIDYIWGVRIIPEIITVTSAFSKDELGWWGEDMQLYRSKVDYNVYTPEQYADNWELINDGI